MGNSDLNTLLSQAENARIVSFDFFDTLFLRTVIDPEDVFDLVGRIVGLRNFREIRKAAQANAFVEMHRSGRKEISLDGIYRNMSIKGVDSNWIKEVELATEKKVALPNKELIPFYNHIVEKNKKIIVTSDMYLPRDYFDAVMEKFELPVGEIFVSSETNCTKRDSGELFDYISNKLNVHPAEILHIGDNYLSDVERAAGRGLKTFHYQNGQIPPFIPIKPSTEYSLSRGLAKQHLSDVHAGSYQALGYHYAGPAAVGFYEWIKEEAAKDKIDHILLVARDGYIIQGVSKFDTQPTDVALSYFKGSRTAFSLASISDTNFHEYLPFLLSGSVGLCPSELLTRINVPLPEEKVFNDLGLSDDMTITQKNIPQMRDLLFALRSQLLKAGQENARGLFMSLSKLGVRNGQKIALVDIGWNGTTQEAFESAVSNMMSLTVTGYYLALNDSPECVARQKRSRMKAMLTAVNWPAGQIKEFYDNRVAVELLFSAPHHSIISLGVDPSFEAEARSDPRRSNDSPLLKLSQDIAEGSDKFASDFYGMTSSLQFKFDKESLVMPLYGLIAKGEWKEDPLFTGIDDFDDWAMTRKERRKIVSY
jgi:HAD superfamily hydrolase (TIGR01549 family)